MKPDQPWATDLPVVVRQHGHVDGDGAGREHYDDPEDPIEPG